MKYFFRVFNIFLGSLILFVLFIDSTYSVERSTLQEMINRHKNEIKQLHDGDDVDLSGDRIDSIFNRHLSVEQWERLQKTRERKSREIREERRVEVKEASREAEEAPLTEAEKEQEKEEWEKEQQEQRIEKQQKQQRYLSMSEEEKKQEINKLSAQIDRTNQTINDIWKKESLSEKDENKFSFHDMEETLKSIDDLVSSIDETFPELEVLVDKALSFRYNTNIKLMVKSMSKNEDLTDISPRQMENIANDLFHELTGNVICSYAVKPAIAKIRHCESKDLCMAKIRCSFYTDGKRTLSKNFDSVCSTELDDQNPATYKFDTEDPNTVSACPQDAKKCIMDNVVENQPTSFSGVNSRGTFIYRFRSRNKHENTTESSGHIRRSQDNSGGVQ